MGYDNRLVVTENSLRYSRVITQNTPLNIFDHSKEAIKKGEEAIGGTWGSAESIASIGFNSGSLSLYK